MTASLLLTRRHLLATATLVSLGTPALADTPALDALAAFLREARSGRAEFSQTVRLPPRAGETEGRVRTSSGSFEFSRPGRFRFAYRKPFEQTLVADGQTLWIHDVDLNQVTARRQAQALGQTPAALLTAAGGMAVLEQVFELSEAAARDGLRWVQATPRQRDGQLQSVQIGFRGSELAALDIADSFGQRSQLRFSALQLNLALPADTFVFRPPAGAEVVRQ